MRMTTRLSNFSPEPVLVAVTVTVALPVFPSLVAVIVAEPATMPVTTPLVFTVAIEVLLLPQVTTRPERVLPLASFGVAVSCAVCPIWMVAVAGLTATEATGTGAAATVTAALPLCPSLVAVIVAEPAVRPVTSPLELTVAIEPLLLCQLTARPESALPLASFGVAVSCTVCPTRMLAVAGLTATDATGTGVTVTAALPLCPSLVAVIVADPATFPVTSPLVLTVATAVLLLAQLTVRPVSVLPLASFGVAVSCAVCPAGMVAVAGLTATEATGTGVTVTPALPLCPSLVAVIVADPAARALTRPLLFTVATAPLLLAHATAWPVIGVPLVSIGVAVSCSVWPCGITADGGVTVTDATHVTVTLAVSELPPGLLVAATPKLPQVLFFQ